MFLDSRNLSSCKKFFDYNQDIVLITHTNSRFQSIGTISDFATKFDQNYMNDKTFENINIKI